MCTTLWTSSNDGSPHVAFQTSKRHRLVIRLASTVPSRCRPENRRNARAQPISVQDGIRCATSTSAQSRNGSCRSGLCQRFLRIFVDSLCGYRIPAEHVSTRIPENLNSDCEWRHHTRISDSHSFSDKLVTTVILVLTAFVKVVGLEGAST